MCAKSLLFASKLKASLWGGVLSRDNYLRDRLTCSALGDQIPFWEWHPQAKISYSHIPKYETTGFVYIYCAHAVNRK